MYGGKVPFDPVTGEMMPYVRHRLVSSSAGLDYREEGVDWRDNEPFEALLEFQGFERGRSAARAIFKDEGEKRYVVFLTDLAEMITDMRFRYGVIGATFEYVKRGSNYGVKLSLP